jgi:hypothetical protein
MNDELENLQKKYDAFEKKHDKYRKTHLKENYSMPKIRINTIDELKIRAQKIYNSVSGFKKIIYDFLNHEGWILEYDDPDRRGKDIMGYAGCGFWDTQEYDVLKWGNTSAQEFYYGELYTQYNLYLKCKILDELYKLFPEYTERKKGWFHQQIDECFGEVGTIVGTILEHNCKLSKSKTHDLIYRIIMTQLFGWHQALVVGGDGDVFPFEYENDDYIQNIIYYECREDGCCGYELPGERFMEEDDEDEEDEEDEEVARLLADHRYYWYYHGVPGDPRGAFTGQHGTCPGCDR